MKISRTMLRHHLRCVTVSYFSHHHLAPTDLADYAPFAREVGQSAERRADLPWLKLGLAHVLTHRDQPCDDLNGGIYAFGNAELLELLETVWETLWPNEKPAATVDVDLVDLVEMPTEQWDEHKQRHTAQSSTK